MKKSLKPLLWVIILVMSVSLIMVFSSGGCRRAVSAGEIIKFDEKYWEITVAYNQLADENTKALEEAVSKSNIDLKEILDLLEKTKKDFSTYSSIFKRTFAAPNRPKALDEFYYKKIEEFDARLLSFQAEDSNTVWELHRLEANKIQRAVYKKYGLDDLINKWQQ